jgi:BlaI family transcriptional regulator, penicillinase repressor
MRRRFRLPGAGLEYEVLAALWDAKAATARDLHERTGAPAGLRYTTTTKVLDRLHAKRLVSRKLVGKAFHYRPAAPRHEIERARARQSLGRLLVGDPVPAIARLVEAIEDIDPALLDDLARAVNARRRSRRA